MALRRQPGLREPVGGKLASAIRHVLTAKDAELKHLLGSQLGMKSRTEVLPRRFGEEILIPFLHQVVYNYPLWLHILMSDML